MNSHWAGWTGLALGICAIVAPRATPARIPNEPERLDLLPPSAPARETSPNPWARQRWLERTARALRRGRGLGPGDPVERWLALPDAQVVQELLDAPEFADVVLDFNLYFLGFRGGEPREADGTIGRAAFESPAAITAAREVLRNGDYWKLFDDRHPVYFPPLREPDLERPETAGKTEAQARDLFLIGLGAGERATRSALAAFAASGERADFERACAIPEDRDRNFRVLLDRAGVADTVGDAFFGKGFRDLDLACDRLRGQKLPPTALAEIRRVAAKLPALSAQLRALGARAIPYRPKRVAQIVAFVEPPRTGLAVRAPFLSERSHWDALRNSSTNFNRKRAAWALKRFFCDDLTPIGLAEAPVAHAEDRHASEPACRACHFKLDPMAAFFRAFGGRGRDYGSFARLVTDDDVEFARSDYDAQWPLLAGGASRAGYVRSATDPAANSYGDGLADLFRVARGAPETRACLVRRLHEYFLGENQAIDPAWLEARVRAFATAAANPSVASARALKATVKAIVLSEAFRTEDRDPERCHDLPPGGDRPGRPPCRVAALLERHCVACHGAAAPAGGLNLADWRTDLDDPAGRFPHADAAGAVVSAVETLRRMRDRLADPDATRRMPRGGELPTADRDALYRWLEERLAAPAPAPGVGVGVGVGGDGT